MLTSSFEFFGQEEDVRSTLNFQIITVIAS